MSGYLLLVIGPVMLAALTMLFIDRHFDGVFFDSGEGGAPLLYEHLAWIFFTGAYMIVLIVRRRGDLGDPADLRAQAAVQPPRRRCSRCSRSPCSARSPGCRTCTSPRSRSASTIFAMLFALALAVPIGAPDLQLDRDALGRHAAPPGGAAVRARRDRIDDVRPRRRARLLRDPGRLAARQHHGRARATRSPCSSAARCSAASPALHYWFPKLTGRTAGRGRRQGRAARRS